MKLQIRNTPGARHDAPAIGDVIEERADLIEAMGAILDNVEAQKRDMKPDERRQFDGRQARVDELTGAISAYNVEHRVNDTGGDPFGSGPTAIASASSGGWLASELRAALGGGSGLGAALTPVESANFVLDHLAAQAVGLRSGFTLIRTTADQLNIPHTTGDGTASWTSENAAITDGTVGGEVITAIPRKLAALQISSNEVLQDSNPDVIATVEARLMRAMANKLDLGFYQGSGTPPEITGLKNVAGIQSVDMGTNGASFTNLDPFADAIGGLETENANATAIVMHPRSWKALLKLKEQTTGNNKPLLQESAGAGTAGVQRSLYGIPVYLSSQVSITETQGSSSVASSVYVYDAPRILAVARLDVRLELNNGGVYFESDQTAIRAISRFDLVVPDPEVVVRIKGVLA
jgi:HK97 family phage major capsid protein